jgi:hypothetical protein
MEASDMLDVLHFFIEEDMNYTSAEQVDGRSRSREIIYQDFYGYSYAYASERNSGNLSAQGGMSKNFDDPIDEEESVVPFDPLKGPTKAFVPATPVNASLMKPFGAALDEPLSK